MTESDQAAQDIADRIKLITKLRETRAQLWYESESKRAYRAMCIALAVGIVALVCKLRGWW